MVKQSDPKTVKQMWERFQETPAYKTAMTAERKAHATRRRDLAKQLVTLNASADSAGEDAARATETARRNHGLAVAGLEKATSRLTAARARAFAANQTLVRRRLEIEAELRTITVDEIVKFVSDIDKEIDALEDRQIISQISKVPGFWGSRQISTHSSYPSVKARSLALRGIRAKAEALTASGVADVTEKLAELHKGLPEIEMREIAKLPKAVAESLKETEAMGV